jgi:hypothetical protein
MSIKPQLRWYLEQKNHELVVRLPIGSQKHLDDLNELFHIRRSTPYNDEIVIDTQAFYILHNCYLDLFDQIFMAYQAEVLRNSGESYSTLDVGYQVSQTYRKMENEIREWHFYKESERAKKERLAKERELEAAQERKRAERERREKEEKERKQKEIDRIFKTSSVRKDANYYRETKNHSHLALLIQLGRFDQIDIDNLSYEERLIAKREYQKYKSLKEQREIDALKKDRVDFTELHKRIEKGEVTLAAKPGEEPEPEPDLFMERLRNSPANKQIGYDSEKRKPGKWRGHWESDEELRQVVLAEAQAEPRYSPTIYCYPECDECSDETTWEDSYSMMYEQRCAMPIHDHLPLDLNNDWLDEQRFLRYADIQGDPRARPERQ